jgi:thioredoxin-related protein
MAQLFNVKVYPTNFVFDKEGKEIARLDGSRPDIAEALEEAIKEARGEGAASAGKAKKKKKSKSR